jgi:flagellar L-ring protein precursor FlgH
LGLGLLIIASGCSLVQGPELTPVNREVFRATQVPQPEVQARSEGSLFVGENRRSLLFVDRKAHLVNDIVTIHVIEAASASGEANTGTKRDSSISGKLETFFGVEQALQSAGVNPLSVVKADLANSFDGSGATSRKNSLLATITAVVREVFPNGNLYIEGKKEVVINNERQYIVLSGVVRPEDIGPDNGISSDLIADARIEYSGHGVLAEKQRPGWLGRVIDMVWPF